MWSYNYGYSLYHHGILGQKWGVRNGPPYPLDESDHSVTEKRKGWQKSLDTSHGKAYNKGNDKLKDKEKLHLTDKQKKAVKIGAAAAVTALAAVGTYHLVKSGKINSLALIGKSRLAGGTDNIVNGDHSQVFKRLSHNEPIADVLKNTNPLRGTTTGDNNCSACGIAAFLRKCGYDVTAKGTGGAKQNLGGMVESCFKNAKVFDGSAVKFGRSRNDAAEMLVRRFGNNAEGVCNIQWKGRPDGHVFNWVIKDGAVSFFDAQNGWDDAIVSKAFWGRIDPQGFLQLARLDGLELNLDGLKKFVG